MSENDYTENIDFDGKWKTLIEALFEEFILFFLPELHTDIDFSYPAKFLKQELTDIAGSEGKKGEMITDNLIEVRFNNGENRYVLIHIEVHGYENVDFGEKMFSYLCRIYDKHPHEITTLAILLADRLPKNYRGFQHQLGRTKISYEFPVYIVREQDKTLLLAHDNPFALAVLACQQIYQTRKQYPKRMILKSQLFELIWKRHFVTQKFSRDIVIAIAGFVNNLMRLPKKLEDKYQSQSVNTIMNDINAIEKKKQEPHYQFVDKLFQAMHGESLDTFFSRLENIQLLLKKSEQKIKKQEEIAKKAEAKRVKEEAKRKEEETKRKEEETKRKEFENKSRKFEHKIKEEEAKRKKIEADTRQQQINTILLLRRLNQSAEQISTELKFDLDFVKQVIADEIS